jgi:hypothetical protein
MSPLLGGEFVIGFIALKIALWIWRSRASLGALLHDDEPPPNGGVPVAAPRLRPRPTLRLAPPPAERLPSLPRAA